MGGIIRHMAHRNLFVGNDDGVFKDDPASNLETGRESERSQVGEIPMHLPCCIDGNDAAYIYQSRNIGLIAYKRTNMRIFFEMCKSLQSTTFFLHEDWQFSRYEKHFSESLMEKYFGPINLLKPP